MLLLIRSLNALSEVTKQAISMTSRFGQIASSMSSSRGFVNRYILVNNQPVRCDDLVIWYNWMESNNCIILKDRVNGIEVRTSFTGYDYGGGFNNNPIVFETTVLRDYPQIKRFSNYHEAKMCHELFVRNLITYFMNFKT